MPDRDDEKAPPAQPSGEALPDSDAPTSEIPKQAPHDDAPTEQIPVQRPPTMKTPPPRPSPPTPAAPGPGPEPAPPPPVAAKPQRVGPATPPQEPKRKRGKWLAALVGAVVLVAVLVAAVVYLTRDRGPSQESQIRSTIDTFVKALGAGDIQTLRRTSCGALANYYNHIPDDKFADIYKTSQQQKTIPVVQSIDSVKVGDNNAATAQVTAFMQNAPDERSTRTVNLQHSAQGWKVCDPPS